MENNRFESSFPPVVLAPPAEPHVADVVEQLNLLLPEQASQALGKLPLEQAADHSRTRPPRARRSLSPGQRRSLKSSK